MDNVLILLQQSIIMFILILVGYCLYKMKLISDQGSKEFSNILIRVIIPCVIIDSYMQADFSAETLKGLCIMFGLSLLALGAAMLFSFFVFGTREKINNFSSSFSNAGFMGIPLVQATLGTDAVFYVAVFVALLNIFQWTYGLLIMTGDKKHISVKRIITNPVLIGFAIAIVLYICPVQVPDVAAKSIEYIGAMNTAVAMIVLGVYVAQTDILQIFTKKNLWWCSICRLILVPVITIVLLSLIPVPEEYVLLKQVVIIAAATPVGSNVAIFARLYGEDHGNAVQVVCLSTILCIFTMPLMLWVSNFVI